MKRLKWIWWAISGKVTMEDWENLCTRHDKLWLDYSIILSEQQQLKRDIGFAQVANAQLKYERDLLGGEEGIRKQSNILGEEAIRRIKNDPH